MVWSWLINPKRIIPIAKLPCSTGQPSPQLDRRRSGGNRSGSLARFEARVRIFRKPFAHIL